MSHLHNSFVANEPPQIIALHNESLKNTHHVAKWWEREKSEHLMRCKSTPLQRDNGVTSDKALMGREIERPHPVLGGTREECESYI